MRQKLHNIGFGNDFLDMTQKAKEKTDQLDFIILNLGASETLSMK